MSARSSALSPQADFKKASRSLSSESCSASARMEASFLITVRLRAPNGNKHVRHL